MTSEEFLNTHVIWFQAISSSSERRMTLSQIYDWMVAHIPYFADRQSNSKSAGWKVKFKDIRKYFSLGLL